MIMKPEYPYRCEICLYWESDDLPLGYCYLNPPTVVPLPTGDTGTSEPWAVRPKTRAEDWCGSIVVSHRRITGKTDGE